MIRSNSKTTSKVMFRTKLQRIKTERERERERESEREREREREKEERHKAIIQVL